MKPYGGFVLALLVATPAVGADDPSPAERTSAGLVFHHAWTAPSEVAALDALVNVFKKSSPRVVVKTSVADVRGRIFTIVRNGQSDGFNTQAGATLQPFLDADLLDRIDTVWAAEKLDAVIPPVLRRINLRDGHHYSLPLAVHRSNLVWYNKALLDKHRIDPATLTSWDSFFKAAEALRAAGVRRPIQMALTWTATAVFEGIMAGIGPVAYEDWCNGRIRKADDPRSLEAFRTFRRYLDYVNDDHADIPWDKALKRVVSGESAFVVMGDWAEGEFRIAGMKYGADYGAIPVPATQGMYGLVVDAFALPRRRPHDENGTRWLRAAASREGQDAFNSLKGSIPARMDADLTKYGPYQRSAIKDLKAARFVYPCNDILAPETFKVRQAEVIAAFAQDQDVAKAAAALAEVAVQTEKHFQEPWSHAQQ
jgi:glucose/mannose transport system substrate-binding protein